MGNYWIAGNTQPNTIPEGLGVSLIRNNYKQFDKNLQILGDISKTNASTITLCPSPTISPNDEYGSIYLMSHKSTATSASNSGRVTIGCKNNWTFTLTVDGYQDKVIIGNGLRATPAKWSSTNYKLFVEKGIMTEAVKIANINSSNWSDFVFDKNYILKPIEEVEKFINVNKHLPDVPSAREVSETGIELAKMDATLLQKIEELQLYIIQLNKRINTLELNAENK